MEQELNFIVWLQQLRSSEFDIFFKFLNMFDTEEFFLLLIVFTWFYNWKFGAWVYSAIILRSIGVLATKDFFASPRPYELLPDIGLIKVSGYGFPSGGAASAVLFSGLILSYCKGQWKWFIAPLVFFLLSFSRVYLGVHFPRDILGGWIIGAISWAALVYCAPILDSKLKNLSPTLLLFLCISLLTIITFMIPALFLLNMIAIGFCVGQYINCNHKIEPLNIIPGSRSTLRGFLGLIFATTLAGIFCLLHIQFPSIPKAFLLVMFGSTLTVLGNYLLNNNR